ncbi:putative ferric-chelate reductase 1 isoform X1 [Strongylocentrotus purpuratus]|uniref:Ferric-chelate reductase 1 n=1 Tax=Strongylocentrotus purpuratus TaxID=7668 RepID=A0A7M7T3W7_STRPU|nr:putative ferric-chelate reductase 1 isoform X1 [Strongylocentrotus purpuratus]
MMNIWMVPAVLLLSSTYLVTGHGDDTHDEFQGDPYSDDGCGETRGCFDCRDNLATCKVNVAWEPNPHEGVVKFTLWGTKVADQAHVSVGITPTGNMANADVYSCISDDTGLVMGRSRNPETGRTTTARPLKGVSGQEVSVMEGMIRCQFNRNMSLDDGDDEFFDINNISYFLILSAGTAAGGTGQGHDVGANRGLSASVDLSQTFSVGAGESMAYLMKLHGCLMIIAWIGLASVGLTMARFFKPMWPDSKLCDVKIWFAVHRACMVLALLLFVIGFIVIFVHVGGFLELGDGTESRRRFSHAVLGVIVTALGVINPIMAIFRPHPGTPKRSIFNWAHWAVGTSALILSFVTIGLALVPIAEINILPNLQGYTFWVLIGFCVFMFVMWVIFEVVRCSTDSEGRTNDIPLSDKNDTVQAADDTGPSLIGSAIREFCISRNLFVLESEGSMLKTILLFIFSLGAVFATAFLIITIAIA